MNTWHDGMMAWYISERVAFVDFGIARGDSSPSGWRVLYCLQHLHEPCQMKKMHRLACGMRHTYQS